MSERLGADQPALLRGYGPLVAFVVLMVLVTTLAPTIAPEQLVTTTTGATEGSVRTIGGSDGETTTGGGSGQPASGGGTAAACPGPQVPGDPYSPPCISFVGSNGGATSRGVSSKEIRIAYRLTADPSF